MTKWKPRNAKERKAANDTIRFIQALKHTKGKWAGTPFDPFPWQEHEVLRPIFGTLNPDGYRQFRTAYIEVPKKAGKSEIAAAVALKLLFADNEPGAEIYSAAVDLDQARNVFDVAAQMVRNEPALDDRAKIIDSSKRIIVTKGVSAGSFYRAIPADAAGSDGFNPHGVIFDEIHRQPNRELWQVLNSSTAARQQPLMFGITTAGFDRHSLCWDLHIYALGLLKRRDPKRYAWADVPTAVQDDPTFFACVYGVEETADWTDPKVWARANPSLGLIVSPAFLEKECHQAQESPLLQNDFRRLHLNQWTSQESRWLDMRIWSLNAGAEETLTDRYERLKGRTCYAGLDLASTIDIAALVLIFPPRADGERYEVLPYFWVPEERMQGRSRRDSVPYDYWTEQGYLQTTPGNVIDYAAIRQKIDELARQFYIAEMAFDPWNATQLSIELGDLGMTMVEHRQGFASMSAPTKELMRLVMEKQLAHNANPVLDWMADNLVVETDPAGNLKPSRKKSTQKIDGMVALIMAIDRAVRHEPSVYEQRPILVLG